ncbi:MAG: 30S ribosomal protein S17 [Candidatus Obscuribacterales bacterium]|jgi:small subunit ribosomal protein S17
MPKKELVGKVVSNKMDKTVVVAVDSYVPHPRYEKQIVRTAKFKAHDAENKCQLGDKVRIQECRPLSRDKHFTVIQVIGSTRDLTVPTEELG